MHAFIIFWTCISLLWRRTIATAHNGDVERRSTVDGEPGGFQRFARNAASSESCDATSFFSQKRIFGVGFSMEKTCVPEQIFASSGNGDYSAHYDGHDTERCTHSAAHSVLQSSSMAVGPRAGVTTVDPLVAPSVHSSGLTETECEDTATPSKEMSVLTQTEVVLGLSTAGYSESTGKPTVVDGFGGIRDICYMPRAKWGELLGSTSRHKCTFAYPTLGFKEGVKEEKEQDPAAPSEKPKVPGGREDDASSKERHYDKTEESAPVTPQSAVRTLCDYCAFFFSRTFRVLVDWVYRISLWLWTGDTQLLHIASTMSFSPPVLTNEAQRHLVYGSPNPGSVKHRYDFADYDSGARIVDSSPAVKNVKAIQRQDSDSYMLAPCDESIWFVMAFNTHVYLRSIVLDSQELFSSTLRTIEILGSDHYPTRRWRLLAVLLTQFNQSKELFNVRSSCSGLPPPSCWVRFIKFRVMETYRIDRYGYCTLNRFQVFGDDVFESLDTKLKGEEVTEETELEAPFASTAPRDTTGHEETPVSSSARGRNVPLYPESLGIHAKTTVMGLDHSEDEGSTKEYNLRHSNREDVLDLERTPEACLSPPAVFSREPVCVCQEQTGLSFSQNTDCSKESTRRPPVISVCASPTMLQPSSWAADKRRQHQTERSFVEDVPLFIQDALSYDSPSDTQQEALFNYLVASHHRLAQAAMGQQPHNWIFSEFSKQAYNYAEWLHMVNASQADGGTRYVEGHADPRAVTDDAAEPIAGSTLSTQEHDIPLEKQVPMGADAFPLAIDGFQSGFRATMVQMGPLATSSTDGTPPVLHAHEETAPSTMPSISEADKRFEDAAPDISGSEGLSEGSNLDKVGTTYGDSPQQEQYPCEKHGKEALSDLPCVNNSHTSVNGASDDVQAADDLRSPSLVQPIILIPDKPGDGGTPSHLMSSASAPLFSQNKSGRGSRSSPFVSGRRMAPTLLSSLRSFSGPSLLNLVDRITAVEVVMESVFNMTTDLLGAYRYLDVRIKANAESLALSRKGLTQNTGRLVAQSADLKQINSTLQLATFLLLKTVCYGNQVSLEPAVETFSKPATTQKQRRLPTTWPPVTTFALCSRLREDVSFFATCGETVKKPGTSTASFSSSSFMCPKTAASIRRWRVVTELEESWDQFLYTSWIGYGCHCMSLGLRWLVRGAVRLASLANPLSAVWRTLLNLLRITWGLFCKALFGLGHRFGVDLHWASSYSSRAVQSGEGRSLFIPSHQHSIIRGFSFLHNTSPNSGVGEGDTTETPMALSPVTFLLGLIAILGRLWLLVVLSCLHCVFCFWEVMLSSCLGAGKLINAGVWRFWSIIRLPKILEIYLYSLISLILRMLTGLNGERLLLFALSVAVARLYRANLVNVSRSAFDLESSTGSRATGINHPYLLFPSCQICRSLQDATLPSLKTLARAVEMARRMRGRHRHWLRKSNTHHAMLGGACRAFPRLQPCDTSGVAALIVWRVMCWLGLLPFKWDTMAMKRRVAWVCGVRTAFLRRLFRVYATFQPIFGFLRRKCYTLPSVSQRACCRADDSSSSLQTAVESSQRMLVMRRKESPTFRTKRCSNTPLQEPFTEGERGSPLVRPVREEARGRSSSCYSSSSSSFYGKPLIHTGDVRIGSISPKSHFSTFARKPRLTLRRKCPFRLRHPALPWNRSGQSDYARSSTLAQWKVSHWVLYPLNRHVIYRSKECFGNSSFSRSILKKDSRRPSFWSTGNACVFPRPCTPLSVPAVPMGTADAEDRNGSRNSINVSTRSGCESLLESGSRNQPNVCAISRRRHPRDVYHRYRSERMHWVPSASSTPSRSQFLALKRVVGRPLHEPHDPEARSRVTQDYL